VPFRNRQAASSTLVLGSNYKKTNEFLKPVTYRELIGRSRVQLSPSAPKTIRKQTSSWSQWPTA